MPELKEYLKGKKVEEIYVEPHKKKSREVTEKDLPRLLEDAKVMLALCYERSGQFPSAFAIAHMQITKKDPLRFFVTYNGDIIVNPVMTRHVNYTVKKKEGCMSFGNMPMVDVDRFHKIEVEARTVEFDKLTEVRKYKLSSKEAQIFQHEMDHFDCINIYKDIL